MIVMDGSSILIVGLLLPILQLTSLVGLLTRRQHYRKRRATMRSCYIVMITSIVPWLTYGTFVYIVMDFVTGTASRWLIVLWASLSIANRVILPIHVGLLLLPPYPPRAWLTSIYRLSAIGMSVMACYMTQVIFPMAW